MKALLEKPGRYVSRIKREAQQRRLKRQQDEVLALASSATRPDLTFKKFSDELWLWANTVGYREHQTLRDILPAMPDEGTQARFTGLKGDETMMRAFDAYALVKQLSEKYLGRVSELQSILDFGCGWGRMVRFFLKDLEPSRIWGADCLSSIIDVCQQTNKWCNFRVVDPLPPTTFPDETFDLIYSFSVFSHLSEDAHNKWLHEFNRLLRPGGLLITTTMGRQFIEYCRTLREVGDVPTKGVAREIAKVFPNTEQSLSEYDNGKYCHHPLDGGDLLNPSFFGETCIPKGYVLNHWTKQFEFLEFIEGNDLQSQNAIVVKKVR
jgi:ubiquinone/menaquinone biosynthesis C-methylase UbiE